MSGDTPLVPTLLLPRGLSAAALLLAAVVAGGCDGVTDLEPDAAVSVRTDAATYTLRETPDGRGLETDIPFRFENGTITAICMAHCRGAFEIGLVDASGDLVWSPALPACLSSPPIRIPAGETYRDTLAVFHGLDPSRRPRFEGDPEGTFRVDVVAARGCGGEEVPAELRTSNAFELVRE